jgi:adenylyl-sulfate kinase
MSAISSTRPDTAARRAWLGHRGAMVWLTGLPAAGKTTLATALEQRLLAQRVLAATVDGDRLRTGLSRDLGFSDADRRENIRRAAELGFALADAGVVAIVALISPFRAERDAIAVRAQEMGTPFAEVFVNAPLAICEQRDPKGLYRRARAGQLANFTGIAGPYESPRIPALELHTDVESVAQSLEKLATLAVQLARADGT